MYAHLAASIKELLFPTILPTPALLYIFLVLLEGFRQKFCSENLAIHRRCRRGCWLECVTLGNTFLIILRCKLHSTGGKNMSHVDEKLNKMTTSQQKLQKSHLSYTLYVHLLSNLCSTNNDHLSRDRTSAFVFCPSVYIIHPTAE